MDRQEIRAFAALAAAITHSGQAIPQGDLTAYAARLVPWITGQVPARLAITISTEGDPMPLNVDSENAVAVLSFADDRNEALAPPDGAVATATSSDPTILGVGAGTPGTDANGIATIVFPLTEVAQGTATLSVHATGADGVSPLLGPDGTTPIADPDPVAVTVNPGAAAAERFTVPDA